MGVFQPRYIFADELARYGLPSITSGDEPDVLDLVDTASTSIDEYCGRTDGDGNGSLVYTTYQERLKPSVGSSLFVIPKRPLVALTVDTVQALQTADIASGGNIYTGCLSSPNTLANGTLSAIISASGRYMPTKRDRLFGYDTNYNMYNEILNDIALFGGPASWFPMDMQNLDYDVNTGELSLFSGAMFSQYNEIVVVYNSGFDPRNMPSQIKRACAAITKNLMAKGSGTTGMTSFSSSSAGANASFDPDIIDRNVQRLLSMFVTVRAT